MSSGSDQTYSDIPPPGAAQGHRCWRDDAGPTAPDLLLVAHPRPWACRSGAPTRAKGMLDSALDTRLNLGP